LGGRSSSSGGGGRGGSSSVDVPDADVGADICAAAGAGVLLLPMNHDPKVSTFSSVMIEGGTLTFFGFGIKGITGSAGGACCDTSLSRIFFINAGRVGTCICSDIFLLSVASQPPSLFEIHCAGAEAKHEEEAGCYECEQLINAFLGLSLEIG